jgi:tetratricopeptide (TPR) repeat protein
VSPTSDKLDRVLASAANALRSGDLTTAESLARQALDLEPESIVAKFLLGVLYARKGEPDSAAVFLSQVLDADPRAFEALISLSNLHREAGRFEEATSLAVRAVEVRPADPQALNNLGRCLMAERKLDEAAAAFGRAIAIQPGFAAAYHNLGRTKQLEGKDGEAADAYSRAVKLAPTLENFLALGRVVLNLYDSQGAAECARQCLQRYPSSAEAHLILCGALIDMGESAEAEAHLQRALELDPERKEALQIATRQRPLGHVEEANENLRSAIRQNPRNVLAYGALMHNQKITEADRPLVMKAQELLSEQTLSPTESISIHYGLGKAMEDLGDFGDSMRHYDEANRISRAIKIGDVPFDEAAHVARLDRLIQLLTPGAQPIDNVATSDLPVLIVGTMRSGTTLAEQILSSHPRVAAGGEQLFWSKNWTRAATSDGEAIDPGQVSKLGHEYIEFLRRMAPDADRVTDKMPGNYMFAGLISQALPNARIIHMRRNPVDTCISIWATPNHIPPDGEHDKQSLVCVYRLYMRLMEHWRSVLPSDRFIEVDYEELVSDREDQTRRLIEFCGLPWDEACLSPEENRRMVTTPSAWQVRQPVYRTSVERWRRFEPYLGAFSELVGVSHPAIC